MKKLLLIALSLSFVLGTFTGCGKTRGAENTVPPTDTSETVASSAEPDETKNENAENPNRPEISENKQVVTESEAPEVYLLVNTENTSDGLTYHLADCTLLDGKEKNKITWSMVKAIGLWQCAECNPPRYEDYKNAE